MAAGTIMVGIIVTDTITIEADVTMAGTITIVTIDIIGAGDMVLFQAVMVTIQAGATITGIEVLPTEAIIEEDIEEDIPDPAIVDPDMADIRNSSLVV